MASRGASSCAPRLGDHFLAEIDAGDGPSPGARIRCACTPVPQPRSSSLPDAAPWRRRLPFDEGRFRSVILVLIQEIVPGRVFARRPSRKNLLQRPRRARDLALQSGQGRSEDRSRGGRSVRRWDGSCRQKPLAQHRLFVHAPEERPGADAFLRPGAASLPWRRTALRRSTRAHKPSRCCRHSWCGRGGAG